MDSAVQAASRPIALASFLSPAASADRTSEMHAVAQCSFSSRFLMTLSVDSGGVFSAYCYCYRCV